MTRPNILILMVDQLTGTLMEDGPADFLHAPNLRRLAEGSARFSRAYCPSPLCAPARASVMAGQLPRRTGVYDNAAEFRSDTPCYTHHLRAQGYQTTLSGKMHFVGPDQLHGFEERLTTDIYPADFGWTPDYRKPGERIDWWYHNLGSVTGAGVAEITNQLEYDDDVAHLACQKLYDLARGQDARPWCLHVSFTHPHDPFVARRKYWDLYEGSPELEPSEAIPYDAQDAHGKRLLESFDYKNFDASDDQIRRAKRGYYANISYIDDKVGEILDTLDRTRQEAVIVFLSDHGEMLGDRGLWFKMAFYENSGRVPFWLSGPGITPQRVDQPVSTLDMLPTLCDLAGCDMSAIGAWTDGESLLPLLHGTGGRGPVPMEYAAEGSIAPMVGLVEGAWKYIACDADPELLFNLEDDPGERHNLADDPAYAAVLDRFRQMAKARWDLKAFDAEVRASQARRWVVYDALRAGRYTDWDFQPYRDASQRYMRNHMDLNVLEDNQRFPRGE
ncbi:choline-sulfatase [Pararhodobacter marinus]|uniref:Choline-sulfatase n=1 Tax=Pararhodobacter marinus TaxID=2184063 RepID=A0A2U2CE20_9RHOB|nr:choline-sulfatase [Pararhodobacter marinus]PWE30081.1 choline-sulfatase [Pararhodobacter marinus]